MDYGTNPETGDTYAAWPIISIQAGQPYARWTLLQKTSFGERRSRLKNVRGAVWISDDGCPGGVGRAPKRSVPEAAGPRTAPTSSVPCPRT
jgi:hypothetical protein